MKSENCEGTTENHTGRLFTTLMLGIMLAAAGCGEDEAHTERDEPAEKTLKVCGFKEGRGVFVGEETRKAIGLATVEVQQKTIPLIVRGTARVFEPGRASVMLDRASAEPVGAGTRVLLDEKYQGEVLAVERAMEGLNGADELLVGFKADGLAPGTHVVASLELPAGRPQQAVPESSVLTTAMGDFVFTANGEHFLRTPVKTAGMANGWVAVAEGLIEGDMVVMNGVQELWRIELQATKGGAACCD
jgi:hypothetical protein